MNRLVVVRAVFGAGVYVYLYIVCDRCDVELNRVCQEQF